MEWDISGPPDCRSCATQEEIFPSVVVGEVMAAQRFSCRNSVWYLSKSSVAPREEPILIPKLSPACHPANFMAFLAANMAYLTLLSSRLYRGTSSHIVSIDCLSFVGKGPPHSVAPANLTLFKRWLGREYDSQASDKEYPNGETDAIAVMLTDFFNDYRLSRAA